MPEKAERKKYLFVINPKSGAGKEDISGVEEAIKEKCKEQKTDFKIFPFQCEEEDKEKIEHLIRNYKPDVVVAGGGDGTVSFTGSLLINSPVALGIIPMGSANGLAKNLHIPRNVKGALRNIFDGHIRKVDTLSVNDRTCLHLSDLGFNAHIVKKFSKGDVRGMIAYTWWMFKEYFKYLPHKYNIWADDRKIFGGKAFMVTITNFRKFGSNLTINPQAKMDDGWFEVVILKPFPLINAIKILMLIFKKDIKLHPFRKIVHAKEAVIENPLKAAFHIDGEPMKPAEKIKVKVLPKSLKIIVP